MDYLICPHCKEILIRDKLKNLLSKRDSIINFLLLEVNRNEIDIESIKRHGNNLKFIQKQILFIEDVMEFIK